MLEHPPSEFPKVLERFFREVRDIHRSAAGVPETSYYPALAKLFDAVGSSLQPRVTCIMSLRNRGAGLPDGGFFTPDQLRNVDPDDSMARQIPSRGAVEVKPPLGEIDAVVGGEQVSRYAAKYGQVLVTNLRQFRLVTAGAGEVARAREGYRIADSSTWPSAV